MTPCRNPDGRVFPSSAGSCSERRDSITTSHRERRAPLSPLLAGRQPRPRGRFRPVLPRHLFPAALKAASPRKGAAGSVPSAERRPAAGPGGGTELSPRPAEGPRGPQARTVPGPGAPPAAAGTSPGRCAPGARRRGAGSPARCRWAAAPRTCRRRRPPCRRADAPGTGGHPPQPISARGAAGTAGALGAAGRKR